MAGLGPARLRELMPESSILLDARASGREDAVRQAGAALVASGAVSPHYVDAMIERERALSTYLGEGIAMVHGTLPSKDDVLAEALVLLRFDPPIDWTGEQVTVVFGVAARGRGYIALISQLAVVLLDADRAAALRAAKTPAEIYALF